MSAPARPIARSRSRVAGHLRRHFAVPGVGDVPGRACILLRKAPAARHFEGGES